MNCSNVQTKTTSYEHLDMELPHGGGTVRADYRDFDTSDSAYRL